MHPAEVGGAGADVDDQHVFEPVQAIGHSKRLAAEHDRIDVFARGIDDGLTVVHRRFGRRANDAVDQLICARLGEANGFPDQVTGRLEIGLGFGVRIITGLDDTLLERLVHLQRQALLDGFLAVEHFLLQQLQADDVLGVADDRIDRLPHAVAGRHRSARRAKVHADIKHAVVLLDLGVVATRFVAIRHRFLFLAPEATSEWMSPDAPNRAFVA